MKTGAEETLRHRGGGGGGGKRKCRREAAAGCCRQLPTDLSSGTCRSRAMSFYAFLFPSRRRFAESKNYCRLSFVRATRSSPPLHPVEKRPFFFFFFFFFAGRLIGSWQIGFWCTFIEGEGEGIVSMLIIVWESFIFERKMIWIFDIFYGDSFFRFRSFWSSINLCKIFLFAIENLFLFFPKFRNGILFCSIFWKSLLERVKVIFKSRCDFSKWREKWKFRSNSAKLFRFSRMISSMNQLSFKIWLAFWADIFWRMSSAWNGADGCWRGNGK